MPASLRLFDQPLDGIDSSCPECWGLGGHAPEQCAPCALLSELQHLPEIPTALSMSHLYRTCHLLSAVFGTPVLHVVLGDGGGACERGSHHFLPSSVLLVVLSPVLIRHAPFWVF